MIFLGQNIPLDLGISSVDSQDTEPSILVNGHFNIPLGSQELVIAVHVLGTHGFMKTHKQRDSIGAFINIELSGTGGLDLVCQSGLGSWPSHVYAQSAIYSWLIVQLSSASTNTIQKTWLDLTIS